MGSPPSPETGTQSRSRRQRLLLAAALGGSAGLAGAWWGSDHLARRVYDSWRPRLQVLIGRGLGHPVQLGPYKGLRPWGLSIGPSRVLSGPAERSNLRLDGIGVNLDPLASLVERAPVLELRPRGAQLSLIPNAQGQLWVFGPAGDKPPPRLTLKILLEQPARLQLGSSALDLKLQGRAGVRIHNRSVDWRATARERAGNGRALARGSANWRSGAVKLGLDLRRWDLAPLVSFIPRGRPPRQQSLKGTADGRLELDRRRGSTSCRGSLRIGQLELRDPLLPAPLQARRLTVGCRGQEIQLEGDPWQMANWRGTVKGSLVPGSRFDLRFSASDPQRGDRLGLGVSGPWRQPLLALDGHIPLGKGTPTSPQPLKLNALIRSDWRSSLQLRLDSLRLRSGRSEITAKGQIWPQLDVRSERLRLHPSLWQPAGAAAQALLGSSSWLDGGLLLAGTLRQPTLSASFQRQGSTLLNVQASAGPSDSRAGPLGRIQARLTAPSGLRLQDTLLLGAASADLAWSDDQLRLLRFESPELSGDGSLPLRWQRRRGLVAGDLGLNLELRPYALARLGPLLGSTLQGDLSARGRLSGPLAALRPDFWLSVRQPGGGPLQLLETWEGRLTARSGGGGDLAMTALAPAQQGSLTARLNRSWLPSQVELRRQQGVLSFSGDARRYRWQASRFPLVGLQLAVGGSSRPRALDGLLSGKGILDLQPLAMEGSVAVERPLLLGVRGQRLTASGRYTAGQFNFKGELTPLAGGTVALSADGERKGRLRSRIEGRGLPLQLFQELAQALTIWRGGSPLARGKASDLGTLVIDTLGGTIDGQLQALRAAQARLADFRGPTTAGSRTRLEDLRGLVDLDISLAGPDLERLNLDLGAKGHLWLRADDRDEALRLDPFQVRLEGPIRGGKGSFSLENLPLALLALATPVPSSLRGGLNLEGSYQLGSASRKSAFSTSLSLIDASLNGIPLRLEDATVSLDGDALALSAALSSEGADSRVALSGTVPLDPTQEGLKLRLSSRGDGLRFISTLVGRGLEWRKGSADLELLMRGSLLKPLANGFLRFRDGELVVAGQEISQLQATVLFDFEELLVQEFKARMGSQGELDGSGGLGLFRDIPQRQPLNLTVKDARIKAPRLNALTNGSLALRGSLLQPLLSGELSLSRGTINGQPGTLAQADENGVIQPKQARRLVEESWNFEKPLLLLGPEVESDTALDLRDSIPRVPLLRLSNLRLKLGPDLEVVVPPVASFKTGGTLTLNGRIDPSLSASGVVRLLGGRLSLFTTNFTLDPDAPNVAVFTPSLGLIPYVDIALRTRVSNTLKVGQGREAFNDFDLRGGYTPLDQLNLVRVVVTVSGPADRIAESLTIRSSPPLPEERLVALIGGNSLAGLSGGNATAALATVFGQSLLSPLVGTLSNVFGQRVSFSLFPTFFSPSVNEVGSNASGSRRESRRAPAQLVLGSELGLDITERFNFSVLAAPNRTDIPPQLTLRYQASDTLGLQGSFDTEGRWQGQLQLFFRF
ncbi:translocation/assembly module TamB domain-containing protein [Synechococcus sp. Cruz-9H2]|uniref:translocation/assembly module TamB domain-containing protein n=1 Tax=unclassified Synechococcus TaxID=2626047 RepID=UPI0020CF18DE|nr:MULTISPECIES: translocation/assembly module TamB domain-containing protein [unclassified Synechococcus]MCP9818117.1 translocation/assembly module TamB domain-containing protein [Synechococcus sp. Cruz-9H2]MCP9842383.1 translocation/assembly module TamB domain-containing protein [Synechococcus sp. Edmonson 11F2]MCP9854513.1 translocation/assembly module TamB domain-containing protein [Synechococcus sp. Cruz-9C9]MCP9861791.1 translocation/assembly module TamB domain-containing protein [Synecho